MDLQRQWREGGICHRWSSSRSSDGLPRVHVLVARRITQEDFGHVRLRLASLRRFDGRDPRTAAINTGAAKGKVGETVAGEMAGLRSRSMHGRQDHGEERRRMRGRMGARRRR